MYCQYGHWECICFSCGRNRVCEFRRVFCDACNSHLVKCNAYVEDDQNEYPFQDVQKSGVDF